MCFMIVGVMFSYISEKKHKLTYFTPSKPEGSNWLARTIHELHELWKTQKAMIYKCSKREVLIRVRATLLIPTLPVNISR